MGLNVKVCLVVRMNPLFFFIFAVLELQVYILHVGEDGQQICAQRARERGGPHFTEE